MTYGPPTAITRAHVTRGFDCGRPALDRWLMHHALANEVTGRSRTFVVIEGHPTVVGYYCLSAAIVEYDAATVRVSRGVPPHEPIPAVLLGRLAVDRRHQGRGLGTSLLVDAIRRTHDEVARNAGVRVLLVHAKDHEVLRFYVAHGFESSPIDPLQVMLLMQDVEAG